MRRIFITHSKFQYSFSFAFVAGFILIFFLLGGVSLLSLALLSQESGLTPIQQEIIASGLQKMSLILILVVFLLSPVVFMSGIYLSYKFVGPLRRMETWLEECLLSKKCIFFKARPGDELEEATRILNRILKRLWGGAKKI